MKTKAPEVPYAAFFQAGLTLQLAIGLPVVALVLGLRLAPPAAGLAVLLVFLLGLPLMALVAWLIARGSGWAYTVSTIQALGAMTGQSYGLVAGALLGSRYDPPGVVLWAMAGFLLGALAGWRMGTFVAKRTTGAGRPTTGDRPE